MKPTFRLHFSAEAPDRPGLWISRRNNFISVLNVDASDVERNKRQPLWLDGEWGGCLELVASDVFPLDRKTVEQRIDLLITNAIKTNQTDRVEALQDVRVLFLGAKLEVSKNSQEQGGPGPLFESVAEDRPKDSPDQRVL